MNGPMISQLARESCFKSYWRPFSDSEKRQMAYSRAFEKVSDAAGYTVFPSEEQVRVEEEQMEREAAEADEEERKEAQAAQEAWEELIRLVGETEARARMEHWQGSGSRGRD